MYYLCNENKDADQLCSYCTADLLLCFRICRLLFFLCKGSINFGLDLAWPLFLFKAGAFFSASHVAPMYDNICTFKNEFSILQLNFLCDGSK